MNYIFKCDDTIHEIFDKILIIPKYDEEYLPNTYSKPHNKDGKLFLLKLETRLKCLFSQLLFLIILESSTQCNKIKNKIPVKN